MERTRNKFEGRSALFAALAVLSTSMSACTDCPIFYNATDFSSISSGDRSILVQAVVLHEKAALAALADVIEKKAMLQEAGCLTINEEGDIIEMVADSCESSEDDTLFYDGGLWVSQAWYEDPSTAGQTPGFVDFDDFRIHFDAVEGEQERQFIGMIVYGADEDGVDHLSTELSDTGNDMVVSTHKRVDFDDENRISTGEGLGILSQQGSFDLSYQISDDLDSGWIELVGEDTLRIDLDAPDGDGCYETTLDGEVTRSICID